MVLARKVIGRGGERAATVNHEKQAVSLQGSV